MFLSSTVLFVTIIFQLSGVWSWTSSYPWNYASTTKEYPQWETTPPWTTPPPGLFHNDYDRDSYIMKIGNELTNIKSMLMGILNGIGITTTPSTGASSTFVAFTARLGSMLFGMGHNQIIVFDDVILNRGNGYDARLGVFRCPLAGTYQFSVSIGAYGSNELEIVRNGQDIAKVFTTRYGRDVEDSKQEPKDESKFEEKKEEEKDDDKRFMVDGYTNGYYTDHYGYHHTDNYGYYHTDQIAQPGSAQVIVDLQLGDEVWVRHSSDNIKDVLFGNGMSSFSGTLLRKAK